MIELTVIFWEVLITGLILLGSQIIFLGVILGAMYLGLKLVPRIASQTSADFVEQGLKDLNKYLGTSKGGRASVQTRRENMIKGALAEDLGGILGTEGISEIVRGAGFDSLADIIDLNPELTKMVMDIAGDRLGTFMQARQPLINQQVSTEPSPPPAPPDEE